MIERMTQSVVTKGCLHLRTIVENIASSFIPIISLAIRLQFRLLMHFPVAVVKERQILGKVRLFMLRLLLDGPLH
jgi:hypothetical protein